MRIGRLIEKAATEPADAPGKKRCSAYHSAAENNEATAPQIAAQTPSDRNDTDQSCSRTQPIMGGTLSKRLGRQPPIIYGMSIVQNNLAIHSSPVICRAPI